MEASLDGYGCAVTTSRAHAPQQGTTAGDVLDLAIRIGFVAYGVVHLLIAWLALQLALGHHDGRASNQGALRHLAGEPFGRVLVWAIAIGMFFLVCWRLLEGAVGHRDEEDEKKRLAQRAGSFGKAIVYGAIGVSALKIAIGAGSRSRGRATTAKLLDLPAGPWIVGLAGLAILAYGANMVRRGLTEKYREHLSAEGRSGEAGTAYLLLGKYGYVAKGTVIGIIGILVGYAAANHDPRRSGGLDQALRTVLEQPFGPFLLGVIALGIASYGVFCLVRARHLSR
ncbi:MAG: DUF1206 domain-containing protein [Marmoricola sp.]